MRVEEALNEVRALQSQVAGAGKYCCYRSATTLTTGFAALMAAVVQSMWIPHPQESLDQYLLLWVGVATASVVITGAEILLRYLRSDSAHAQRQTAATVRQFVPCIVAGATLTWAMATFGSHHAAMLPALWSIIFSLGVFASAQHLPRGGVIVAAYYLVAGLVCLRWGQGTQALAPWTMVLTFGVGQSITAVVLYRQQEDTDDAETTE
jgi:hypothetical protein